MDAVGGLDAISFLKLFGPEDLAVMTGIGIIAVFLHRAEFLTARWALILPIGIGLIVGVLQAWTATPGQWGAGLYLTKGILLGGGSGLVGRGVSIALDKAGIFPVANGKPKPPDPPAAPPLDRNH